jgi:hypothetical protein
MKIGVTKNKSQDGITKKEFFAISDKASQPIKHEAESDSETSETFGHPSQYQNGNFRKPNGTVIQSLTIDF